MKKNANAGLIELNEKDSRNGSLVRNGALFILLLIVAVSIGLGVGFFQHTYKPSVTVTLNGNISFEGFDEVALKLDSSEIIKLNNSYKKHRNTFTSISIVVHGKGVMEVTPKSVLSWSMSLATYGDSTVKSWPRKCPRKKLVDNIVIYLNTAADEYEHLDSIPDVKRSIKQIYI